MAARKKRRRRIGGPVARRWFAVGALVLVGLLYYRPLHDYLDARSQRAGRLATVRELQRQQASLEKRLEHASSLPALAAAARTLGYVRPGEHLFIVKDIPQWRRRQHAQRHAASRGHGR
ncbi:MAG TPA: septum formation initiator family protein [Gaiellaceae bacterium]|jgi:cell division protein FtsB|nr:septum formation initiator family protein [Gaiellaceae bacterium]